MIIYWLYVVYSYRKEKKIKKFLQEFKDFAMRGNVMDMAVGVVIGGAFKGIVDSLVNDLINPLLGLFGNHDLTSYEAVVGGAVFRYGAFITSAINFIIMAFVIFMIIKGMNRLHTLRAPKAEEAPAAPTTKICPYCKSKSEIAIDAARCPHCTSEQP